MDISTTAIVRSQRFRTPFDAERSLGLWVDRIGEAARGPSPPPRLLRVLGLYGAVHVVEGEGVFVDGVSARRVSAGQTMILFPSLPHGYYSPGGWRTVWVVWGGPEAGSLERLGYVDPAHPVVRDGGGAVPGAFRVLSLLVHEEDVASALRRKAVLLDMIADLYRARPGREGERGTGMADAVVYLKERTGERVCIEEMARVFHMSTTHFRRCFKSYTGRSPLRYHMSLKISAAKQLLAEGTSIKETARRLGFDDVFYFMRVFKKYAGVPPGTFARQEGVFGGGDAGEERNLP